MFLAPAGNPSSLRFGHPDVATEHTGLSPCPFSSPFPVVRGRVRIVRPGMNRGLLGLGRVYAEAGGEYWSEVPQTARRNMRVNSRVRWRFRRGVWVPTRGLAMKGFFVAHAIAVPLYLPEATSGCPSPARAGPLQERRKRIASQPHTHQKLKNHSNHHAAVLLWPQKLMSGQLTQFSRMNRRFRMNSNTMHPYTTPSGPLDLSLYLVTGDNPLETVRQARHATCIQVRSKPISTRDLYQLTEAIAGVIQPHQTLLIDDRVDVALALRARGVRVDGVHIGQDDLPVADARALLGPDAIIGLTTGTRQLVEESNKIAHLIDYIGTGPFRPSPTKQSNRPPLGLDGLRELAELSTVPTVAIGDITPEDCPAIRTTGVAGIAMVRAFVTNPSLKA